MANFIQGLVQGAVKASPFALQAVQQVEAKRRAELAARIAQMHQQSADNTASVLANIKAGEGLANIGKLNAEVANLQRAPKPNVMRGPGDQLVRINEDGTAVPVGPGPIVKPPAPERIVPIIQGGRRIYETQTNAIGKEAPAPSAAGEPGVFVSDPTNPNAPPTYTRRSEAFGKIKPPAGTGGASSIGGMGSGGIGGLARTSGAITGMGVAHDQMEQYENAIKSGHANYNGLDYFQGLYSKLYDAEGIKDRAAHAAAFATLNRENPELANYLRAAETWALEDSQLSGRASDFRTKMDGFVSAIGPSQHPEQIDNVQRFRATRLDELKKFQPAMQAMAERVIGGRGGAPPANVPHPPNANDRGGNINLGAQPAAPAGGKRTITKDQAAFLKTVKGLSDAEIAAQYTVRP